MNNLSQKAAVLEYMREHGTITPIEALRHIGSFRLGARIWDLKQQGYNIINLNKTGDERYAKYKLADRQILPTPETHTEALQSKQMAGGSSTPKKCIEIKNRHAVGLVQVNEPCSQCGSYYRRDEICNICG